MSDVIVVGAGLAGLTAATYLEKAGLEVTVLEKSDRPGGRVKSDRVDGYILDHGFQVINSGYSEIKDLNLLDDLEFSPLSPNIRLAGWGNRIVGLSHPAGTIGGISGSVTEKLAFASFLMKEPGTHQDLGEIAQNFPTLYRNILKPFLTGVFLTNPDHISAPVARAIMRSFATGRPGVPARGVGSLSEKLASPIKNVRYGAEVTAISAGEVRGNFGTLAAKHVVVATIASAAGTLLGRQLGISSLSSTTWYHCTRDELEFSRYLAVGSGSSIVNSVVMSEISREYAPAGHHLIATTALTAVPESQLHQELSAVWSRDTRAWDLVGRYEIKESLHLHLKDWTASGIQEILPGTYLAGDFTQLPSQQGAMRSGRLAAEAIIRSRK